MAGAKNRRRFKNAFYKWRLHNLFGWLESAFLHLAYLTKVSTWIAKHLNIPFNDFYSPKRDYNKRYELFQCIQDEYVKDNCIDYLEFGVAQGKSIQWWLENHSNVDSKFHGFDTFTGLPEEWGHFNIGDMTNNDNLPQINDRRCAFHKGLFQETLPKFIAENDLTLSQKVIHLDADLYSATLFVLTTLHPHLNKGDILIFDEFNVPLHEFKAFDDYVKSYYVKYEVLAATNNYYQVAMQIA